MKKRNLLIIVLATVGTLFTFLSTTSEKSVVGVTAASADDPLAIAGNKLLNPNLQFSSSAINIPNWKLIGTNNIYAGQNNAQIGQTNSGGRRDIVANNTTGFKIIASNNAYNYTTYAVATGNTASFVNVSQTFNNLVKGSTYYFRAEVRGTTTVSLNVYPNTANSGSNAIIGDSVELTGTTKIIEVAFKATQSQNTVNIRHYRTNGNNYLNIRRIGFYAEDDYLIEAKMNSLFTDASRTKIDPNLSYEEFIRILNELKAEILLHPEKYSAEVIASINAKIAEAEALWDSMETVYNGVTDYAQELIDEYDLDLSELPSSITDIAEEQKGKIDLENFDAESIETYINEGKALVYAELLRLEKERANALLDDMLASMDDSKIAAELVEELKKQINGALTFEEVHELLAFATTLLSGDYTYEILTEPGAHTLGSIVFTNSDFPEKSVTVNLPELNGEDYDISFTEDTPSSVNYLLKDTFLSRENIEFSLSFDQNNLSYAVINEATYTSEGLIVGTSAEYPGFNYAYTLPVLSDEGYTYSVDRDNNKINYVYQSDNIPYSTSVDLVPYNNTQFFWSVASEPTKDSGGVLTGTSYLYPGVDFEVELPKLGSEAYTVNVKDNEVPPYVSYVLKDQTYGLIEIKLPLNDFDAGDTTWEVVSPSKFDVGGVLNGTNPNYPGAVFSQTLPKLNDEDYTREVDNETNEFIYDLNVNPYNVGPFRVAIPEIYYVSLSGLNSEEGDAGTFAKPFATVEFALSKVASGKSKTIVLLEDVEISATLEINNKHITITSSNTELFVEEATSTYTLSGATNNFSLFNVTNNGELIIENITLDAKQTGGLVQDYALIEASNSQVLINDGAVLKGANNSKLGSVLLLNNSPFYMYGGEIKDNEGVANIINSNSTLYLVGGSITNNTQDALALSGNGVTFGYNFVLKNNGVDGKQNFAATEVSNFKVRFDFIGEVSVNDARASLATATFPNVKTVDFDGNVINYNLYNYPGIKPVNDHNLHLVYDHGASLYRWDYEYANEYVLIKNPTSSETGLIAKKAIIDGELSSTVYKDAIILPKLSTDTYVVTPDLANGEVTYTWKDTQYGNIDIVVTIDGTITYEYNVVVDPTFTSTGIAEKISAELPGVVFVDNIVLPALSVDDYDIVLDPLTDTVTYTLKAGGIAPGASVTSDIETFNEGIEALISEISSHYDSGSATDAVTQDAIDTLLGATDFADVQVMLDELDARLEAASKLDELFESFAHGVDSLTEDRYNDAINEIISVNVSDIEDTLQTALIEMTRLQIESELQDYINGLTDYDDALKDKLDDILNDFDNLVLDTSQKVLDFDFDAFVEAGKAELLQTQKEGVIDALDDFWSNVDKTDLSVTDLSAIQDIIDSATQAINNETDIDVLNALLEDAQISVNDIVFSDGIKDAKDEIKDSVNDIISELEDYLTSAEQDAITDYLDELLEVINSTNYDDEDALDDIKESILSDIFDFIGNEVKDKIVDEFGDEAYISGLINEMVEDATTIEELVAILDFIEQNEADLAALNAFIEANKDVIDANELNDVIDGIVEDYINGVITIDLASEKIESIIELVTYFETNDANVVLIVADGITNIVNATTSEDVSSALTNAIDDIVDYERDLIKAELDDYYQNTDNEDIKAIIEAANLLLDDATSVGEILEIYEDTLVKIEIEHLKEYETGNSIIDDYIENIIAGLDDYATDEEKLEALNDAITRVEDASYLEQHVLDLIGDGNEMSDTISDALDDFINQILTGEPSETLLEELLLSIERLIAYEEIQNVLSEEALPYADSFLAGILDLLNDAEDSKAIEDILSEGLKDAAILNDLIAYGEELYGSQLDTKQEIIDEIVNTMLSSDENTLAEAKTVLFDEYKIDVKAELDAYLATIDNPSDEVIAIIDAAKLAIDGSEDITEIDGLVSDAKDAVTLQIAKEDAKAELDAYLDTLDDPASADSIAIVDAAKAEIDNATTISGVTTIVTEAKDDVDDKVADELQAAKDAAKAELDTYLDTLDDPASADSIAIVDAAKAEIDNATTISGVTTIVSDAKDDVDDKVADELQAAKDAAKAELDAYLDTLDDPASADSIAIVDAAKEAIDNATKISELVPIVTEAKDDVDDKVAEELVQAKLDAIAAIDAEVDSLDETKYSPENWQLILDAQSSAIDDINDASTIDAVNDAKDTGLVTINGVPTLLETGYDEPIVDEEPDATSGGTATVTHPDLPGETIEIELPPLNGEDYNVSVDGDEVIYKYVDEETGVTVEVRVELPSEGFDQEVTSAPDASTGGTAVVTHPDLPGLEVEVDLPALDDESYKVDNDYDEDSMTGSVTYTIHDDETGVDIIVEVEYDVNELEMSWDVTDDATFNETGVLSGTSEDLPGVIIEIVLPELSEDDYDITDNGDGTSRYTLKNKNYGDIYFDVPNEEKGTVWFYIILEMIIIIGLLVWAIMKRRKNKEKENEAKASMSVLPLILVVLVEYSPKGWQVIIPLLAVVIVLLALYVVYLYFPRVRALVEKVRIIFIKEKKVIEETTTVEETVITETVIEVVKEETSYKKLEEVITDSSKTKTVREEVIEKETSREKVITEEAHTGVHKTVGETSVHKEQPKKEEVVTLESKEVKPQVVTKAGSKKMPPLYNYSFQARRHLMDEKTLDLYNTFKNHIMKYEGVSVNQTWEHEIFMTSGRAFARLRFHGKTFKLYLDVHTSDYPNPKFPLIDESKRKIDETTSTLLNIKGPKMMKYGLELIDEILAKREVKVNKDYKDANFKVKALNWDTLLEIGLIVLVGGKFKKPVVKEKPIIYNYSFQARLHLMPDKEREMYNKIKNHIEKFSDVTSNQTWDHEIFIKSGRAFAKLRFHGKTFKLYLDVNISDYPNPKFPLIDESKVKAHESTSTLINIKGPRMLQYGLDLINEIATRLSLKVNQEYEEKDYTLIKKKGRELFDQGLIKSSDGTFTLKD